MYLNAVIEQLRKECSMFNKNIGGVFEWNDTSDLSEMKFSSLPVAYVLPNDDEVASNEAVGAFYYQNIVNTFSVLIFIGKERNEKIVDYNITEQAKAQVLRALAGFHPCNEFDRLEYDGGGSIEACTRAFICFKLNFRYSTYIRNGIQNQENVYLDTVKLPNLEQIQVTTQTQEKITSQIILKEQTQDD